MLVFATTANVGPCYRRLQTTACLFASRSSALAAEGCSLELLVAMHAQIAFILELLQHQGSRRDRHAVNLREIIKAGLYVAGFSLLWSHGPLPPHRRTVAIEWIFKTRWPNG